MAEVRLMTPGVLAERLGVPLSRVLYVLRTRRHIRPAARAGILRLYDSKALERLREEIVHQRRAHGGIGAHQAHGRWRPGASHDPGQRGR
jgi:hypothetical protein